MRRHLFAIVFPLRRHARRMRGLPLPREGTYHLDADLAVTRIVHGSLVIDMAKTRLLVDPWFLRVLRARPRRSGSHRITCPRRRRCCSRIGTPPITIPPRSARSPARRRARSCRRSWPTPSARSGSAR
jgi:hypothetical protein